MELTTLVTALKYRSVGWSIIPILPKSKLPTIEWKKFQEQPADEATVSTWFTNTDYGIGLVTGRVSGVVVVDCEAADDWSDLQSPLVSQTGTGGRHFFYRWTAETRNKVRLGGKQRDVRGDGGYVILPPSIHPNGAAYRWIKNTLKKLADLPPFPPEEYTKQYKPKLDWGEVSVVYKGARNESATKVAGSILARFPAGQWESIGWEAFKAWNEKSCQPPLSEMEIRTIWESVRRLEIGKRESQEVKQEGPAELLTFSQAKTLQKSRLDQVPTAPKSGYPALDNMIRAFLPGQLTVIGGYTSVGKTTMAVNIAVNVALQQRRVLFVSLESGVSVAQLATGILQSLGRGGDDQLLDKYFSILAPESEVSLDRLAEIIDRQAGSCSLVIIDHVHYLLKSADNVTSNIGQLVRRLQFIARAKQVPMLLLAHLRKPANGVAQPTIHDLKDSSSLNQDPSTVLLMHRRRLPLNEIQLGEVAIEQNGWILVAKNRDFGRTGLLPFSFDPDTHRIEISDYQPDF